MGLLGMSRDVTAAITDEVERATSEKSVEEDWGLIMNICDKAGSSADDAKNYLKAITKRLYSNDPHIGIKAVTLLDACVKNSGKTFHIEVASREFENNFMTLMTKAHPTVAKKLKESLKKWSENEFKTDKELSLIPSLYYKLKSNGHDFSSIEQPVKKTAPISKDPNVVESQEEADQILKAIELSLKESGSPRNSSGGASASTHTTSSIYPSVNMATTAAASSTPAKEPRKVRALYDFEAAEDNELTFTSGEIIVVLEDSDPNWWKGSNHRGEGLFPANFVTSDLSVEPEKFLYEKAKKMVQFKDSAEIKELKEEPEVVEVDEQKLDRLLHILHEADPTNPEKDTEEMLNLQREVNLMAPLIDSELERVDRRHAQLTQLSADLVDAFTFYHQLMREPQFPPVNKMQPPYGYPQSTQVYDVKHFNGGLPPNMPPMSMMGPPNQERLPPYMQQQGPLPPPPPGIPIPQQHQQQQGPMQGMPYQTVQIPAGTGPPMSLHQIPLQMHQQNEQMGQFSRPGVANNFGPPSLGQMPPFQHHHHPSGSLSQTGIQQNGASQQPPHFVSSSTHLSH